MTPSTRSIEFRIPATARRGVAVRAPQRAPRCQRSADLATYMPLVRKIVGRLRRRLPSGADFDDLLQAGLIGLNDAMSRFEQGHGSAFETYAARRIEGAMLDALRANDLLSRDVRARLREVRQAVQRLEHRLGRAPRAKEVANQLGWPLDRVHQCMVDAGAGSVRSADEALEEAADAPHHAQPWRDADDLAIPERSDPVQALEQRRRHAILNAAFDALEEAERYVMEALYEQDLTLEEVGQELGVSASRVSQIRTRIVAKLRRRLRDA